MTGWVPLFAPSGNLFPVALWVNFTLEGCESQPRGLAGVMQLQLEGNHQKDGFQSFSKKYSVKQGGGSLEINIFIIDFLCKETEANGTKSGRYSCSVAKTLEVQDQTKNGL